MGADATDHELAIREIMIASAAILASLVESTSCSARFTALDGDDLRLFRSKPPANHAGATVDRLPLSGLVRSVVGANSSMGMSDGRKAALPNVDPIYTWVRLAQRIPVRIAIDHVPPEVPLVSGMTATVTIRKQFARNSEI